MKLMHSRNAETLAAMRPRPRLLADAAHRLPLFDADRVAIGDGDKGAWVDILPDIWDDGAVGEEGSRLRIDESGVLLKDCWSSSD